MIEFIAGFAVGGLVFFVAGLVVGEVIRGRCQRDAQERRTLAKIAAQDEDDDTTPYRRTFQQQAPFPYQPPVIVLAAPRAQVEQPSTKLARA